MAIPQSYPEITEPPSEYVPVRQSAVKDGDAVPIKGGSNGTPGCTIFSIVALDTFDNIIAFSDFTNFVYDPITGNMTGSFIMGPNTTDSVRLQVILVNIDGQSVALDSISNSLVVNNVAPTNESVIINQEALTTHGRAVTLTLFAENAQQYMIYGVVVNEPGVTNEWLDYQDYANVRLSGGDGLKTVKVKYRSNSWLEGPEATDDITLEIDPTVALPFGIILSMTRRANAFEWGIATLNDVENPIRLGINSNPDFPQLNHVQEFSSNPWGLSTLQARNINNCPNAQVQLYIRGKRYDSEFDGSPADINTRKLIQVDEIKSIAAGGDNTLYPNEDKGFRAYVDEYSTLRLWGNSEYGQLGNGSYSADLWEYPGYVNNFSTSLVFAGNKSTWVIKGSIEKLFGTGDNTNWILGIDANEETDGIAVEDRLSDQESIVIARQIDKDNKWTIFQDALNAYNVAYANIHPGNITYEAMIIDISDSGFGTYSGYEWAKWYARWRKVLYDQLPPTDPLYILTEAEYLNALANWDAAKANAPGIVTDLVALYRVITDNTSLDDFEAINNDYINKAVIAWEAWSEWFYQTLKPGTPAEIQTALDASDLAFDERADADVIRLDAYALLYDNPKMDDYEALLPAYNLAVQNEMLARREFSYRTVLHLADSLNPAKIIDMDLAEAAWLATLPALSNATSDLGAASTLLTTTTREWREGEQNYLDANLELTYAQASVVETQQVLAGMGSPRTPITNIFTEMAGGEDNESWRSVYSCNGYTLGIKNDNSLWFWGREINGFGYLRITALTPWTPPANPTLSDDRTIIPKQIPGNWLKAIVSPTGVILIDTNNDAFEAFGNDWDTSSSWGLRDLTVSLQTENWIDGYRWQFTQDTPSGGGGDILHANYILLNEDGELYLNQWDNTGTFPGYKLYLINNNKLFNSLSIMKSSIFALEKQQ